MNRLLTLLFLSSAAACGGTGPTALPGTIELTTQTVGPEADDAYLAAIDGGAPFSIGANETRSFETPAGSHSIRFAGLADNCRLGLRTVSIQPNDPLEIPVQGLDSTVTVVSSQTEGVTIRVDCLATGSLMLAARTTGTGPAQYKVYLSRFAQDTVYVPANGFRLIPVLTAEQHRVELAFHPVCHGDPARFTPDIAPGAQASVTFDVTCGI